MFQMGRQISPKRNKEKISNHNLLKWSSNLFYCFEPNWYDIIIAFFTIVLVLHD